MGAKLITMQVMMLPQPVWLLIKPIPTHFRLIFSWFKQNYNQLWINSSSLTYQKLQIINLDFSLVQVLQEKQVTAGGNIVRFDSTTIPNGEYFYQLVSENQKTMKKFVVNN